MTNPTPDPDPLTDTNVGAHRAAIHPLTDEEIHASNLELMSRIETLSNALRTKVEQQEFNKSRSNFFKGLFGIAGVWIVEISIAVYLLFNAIHANEFAHQADARSACQSKVNTRLIEGLKERGVSAQAQNEALDNFLNVLLDPKSSVNQKEIALTTLHNSIHNVALAKDANPLPAEVCK